MRDWIDRHIDHVRELTRRDGALATRAGTASLHNPVWFRAPGVPRAGRDRLHAQYVEERLAELEPTQRRHAIVMAGPPGAGKSTLRTRELVDEVAGHVLIDPDEIKRFLLRQADEDGSLKGFLKPAAVRELEAVGERFFPLELSALVHVEAVQIADVLRIEALERGYPVVIDGVLSQRSQAVAVGRQLEGAGYGIDAVAVDVPFEVSEHRIRSRWREAYIDTLEGKGDLMGGRWVPSDYARAMFDGLDGRSRSAVAAEQLAHEVGAVDRYRVFRTESVAAPMVVTTDLARMRAGGPLVDREAANGHQAACGSATHHRRRAQPEGFER